MILVLLPSYTNLLDYVGLSNQLEQSWNYIVDYRNRPRVLAREKLRKVPLFFRVIKTDVVCRL